MNWTLVLAIILLAAAAAVLVYPLFFQPLEDFLVPGAPVDDADMFSERDALLDALSDLEQDRLTGKLSPEDYALHKAQLEQRYVRVAADEEGGGA